jgi:hypothetical protein
MIRDGDPRVLGSKIWMSFVVVAAALIGLVAGYGALNEVVVLVRSVLNS